MNRKTVARTKNKMVFMVFLLIWTLGSPCFAQQDRPLPIYPQSTQVRPGATEDERARELYLLARKENRRLLWDSCLATKAFQRARQMVAQHYFDHENPKTGQNPVWRTVSTCIPSGSRGANVPAGENLTRGIDTPTGIHHALMESPSHRKNILDRRFNRIGVGCYDNICVELFAGY